MSRGVGLVYWGLTPQQQPGSYQGDEMMMISREFTFSMVFQLALNYIKLESGKPCFEEIIPTHEVR